jgi:hypothetical protein
VDLQHKTNTDYLAGVEDGWPQANVLSRSHTKRPQEDTVMRAALLLVLAVSISSAAGGATVDLVEGWRPMYPFIGTWQGTRSGPDGQVKVTRVYASASTNHHLEITEKVGGRSRAIVGMVSLDPERGLVLRVFATDGSASDVVLDPVVSNATQVVFASLESEGPRTRITYERVGAKNLVERIERSTGGEPFTVVSETRLVRKD